MPCVNYTFLPSWNEFMKVLTVVKEELQNAQDSW